MKHPYFYLFGFLGAVCLGSYLMDPEKNPITLIIGLFEVMTSVYWYKQEVKK